MGAARLEAACQLALSRGFYQYRHVRGPRYYQ
jgi:hypothetical protein